MSLVGSKTFFILVQDIVVLLDTGQLFTLLFLFNLFDSFLEFHLRFIVLFEVALHLFVLEIGSLILKLFLLGIVKSDHVPHRELGSFAWTTNSLPFNRPIKVVLRVEIESLPMGYCLVV